MITSFRAPVASSQLISGSGLAIANTIGFFAILFIMSAFNTPPLLNPINTSASFMLSASVTFFPLAINSFFSSSRSVRLSWISPLVSNTLKFSLFAPSDSYSFIQAIAAAPAPFTTNFALSIFFFCISKAFNKAAALMMAVPC